MYIYDRVCETSTTTGTGNLTLAGALTGYQTFNNGGAAAGNDFHYLIEAVDANGVATGQWEIGVGKCPTTTTLQRVLVLRSSTGSLVSFSAGTKRVHVIVSAYQLRWRGAVAYLGTDLTAQNFTTSTAISWSGTNPDTDSNFGTGNGLWAGGQPTRLTMPATAYDNTTVKLCAQVSLSLATVGEWCELKFKLNGSTVVGRQTFYISTTTPAFQLCSYQPLSVAFNDYFQLFVQIQTDTSVSVLSADTYFTLEMVE